MDNRPERRRICEGGADVAANLSALDTKTKELDGRAPLIKSSDEVKDFNDCTQFGIYQAHSSDSHGWDTSTSWKTVITIPVGDGNTRYPIQIGFSIFASGVYLRSRNGNSGWSAWKQLH